MYKKYYYCSTVTYGFVRALWYNNEVGEYSGVNNRIDPLKIGNAFFNILISSSLSSIFWPIALRDDLNLLALKKNPSFVQCYPHTILTKDVPVHIENVFLPHGYLFFLDKSVPGGTEKSLESLELEPPRDMSFSFNVDVKVGKD